MKRDSSMGPKKLAALLRSLLSATESRPPPPPIVGRVRGASAHAVLDLLKRGHLLAVHRDHVREIVTILESAAKS